MKVSKFSLSVQCVLFAATLAAATPNAMSATIGYYRFEGVTGSTASGIGTILDSASHSSNGTPVGGPTYSANVPTSIIPSNGATNMSSVNFDGVDDRITIKDSAKFSLTKSLTIEAYMKPATLAFGPWGLSQIFFRGDDRGGLDPYFLALTTTGLLFHVENESGGAAEVFAELSSLNQWTHVAGTLDDATGSMELYINETLVASTTTNVRPFASLTGPAPGLGIGSTQGATFSEFFNGQIDELRISDVALAPNQFISSVPEPRSMILMMFGIFAVSLLNAQRRF